MTYLVHYPKPGDPTPEMAKTIVVERFGLPLHELVIEKIVPGDGGSWVWGRDEFEDLLMQVWVVQRRTPTLLVGSHPRIIAKAPDSYGIPQFGAPC